MYKEFIVSLENSFDELNNLIRDGWNIVSVYRYDMRIIIKLFKNQ